MKTIAIANNKGGCGKTATAYNLGLALAAQGQCTLLVDLDPQANLTERFYNQGYSPGNTVADVLGAAMPIEKAIYAVASDRDLHLLPSEFQLANVAFGLLNDAVLGRTALRRALAPLAGHYDLVLVDCPPEAGILLVNALLAADAVICPAEPEEAAFAGVTRVVEMVDIIRREYERSTPTVLGSVATRVDQRTNRHQDGLITMGKSQRTPLLATIPERNGANRDRNLLDAYGPVAAYVLEWMGKGAPAL
jgi:chromosome partitioning protein